MHTGNVCFQNIALFQLYHAVLSFSGWRFPAITLSLPKYSFGCFVVGIFIIFGLWWLYQIIENIIHTVCVKFGINFITSAESKNTFQTLFFSTFLEQLFWRVNLPHHIVQYNSVMTKMNWNTYFCLHYHDWKLLNAI